MTPVLHFAANFWWLIFPLGGAIGAGVRAIAAANERRADRRLERYRLKQQAKIAVAQASGRARNNDESSRRELTKLIAAHDRTDARWLDYEVDIAKLLDFPLMTDMRDPLTIAFHKAKRHADLLRPDGRPTTSPAIGPRNWNTAMPSTSTSVRSRSPRPRPSADAAATSPKTNSNGWHAPRTCCTWRKTRRPRVRNGRTPMRGPARSSTA